MTHNIENRARLSSSLIKGLLLISGLLAVGIATTILCAPDAFYKGYGIDIGADASLVNELKAPAGMLFITGLLMLAGVVRKALTVTSLSTASLVYLSYGLSRLWSMAIDGMPHSGLVSAAILEIALGLICLLVFMRVRKSGFGLRRAARNSWIAPVDGAAR